MRIRLDLCKIRHSMKECGVRQLDIAKKAGTSQAAVSAVLSGARIGKDRVAPAICEILGFKAADIVIIED